MRPPTPAHQRAALEAAYARGKGPKAAREKQAVADRARDRARAQARARSKARALPAAERAARLDAHNAARKADPRTAHLPPVRPWTSDEDDALLEVHGLLGQILPGVTQPSWTKKGERREVQAHYQWQDLVQALVDRGYAKRSPKSLQARYYQLRNDRTAKETGSRVRRPPSYAQRRKPGDPDRRRKQQPFSAREDERLLHHGKALGRPLPGNKKRRYSWALIVEALADLGFPRRTRSALVQRHAQICPIRLDPDDDD